MIDTAIAMTMSTGEEFQYTACCSCPKGYPERRLLQAAAFTASITLLWAQRLAREYNVMKEEHNGNK
jgi:hypothetical protein